MVDTDLSELKGSASTKIAGANPLTGDEDNFLDVDANGYITAKVQGSATAGSPPATNENAVLIGGVDENGNKQSIEVDSDGAMSVFEGGFGTANIRTQITATTTSGQLLAANTNRRYFHIVNGTNNTKTAWIQYGAAAVANAGLPLPVGSSLIVLDNPWQGTINAITSSGTAVLDVFEGTP